jgi:hypothetical protein
LNSGNSCYCSVENQKDNYNNKRKKTALQWTAEAWYATTSTLEDGHLGWNI